MAGETLDDSRWLANILGLLLRTIESGKSRPQASYWYKYVINCYLLLCDDFNEAHTYLPFHSLKPFGSVVLYLILLEVAKL